MFDLIDPTDNSLMLFQWTVVHLELQVSEYLITAVASPIA